MAWLKFNEIKKSEKEITQELYKQIEIIKRRYRTPSMSGFDPDDEETFDKNVEITLNSILDSDALDIAEEPIEFPEDSDIQEALDILRQVGEADELIENYKHTLLQEDVNYAISVAEASMPPEEQLALNLHPDPVASPQGTTWISDDASWGISKDEYGNVNLVVGIKDCKFDQKLLDFLSAQPEAVSKYTKKALGISETIDVATAFNSKQIPEDVSIDIDLSKIKWDEIKIEKAIDVILAYLCYQSSLFEEHELAAMVQLSTSQFLQTQLFDDLVNKLLNDLYANFIKELLNNVVYQITTDNHFYKDIPKVIPDGLFIDQLRFLNIPISLQEFNDLSAFDLEKLAKWFMNVTGKAIESKKVNNCNNRYLKPDLGTLYMRLKKNIISIFAKGLHMFLRNGMRYIKPPSNLQHLKLLLHSACEENSAAPCRISSLNKNAKDTDASGNLGRLSLKQTNAKACQNKIKFKRPKFNFITYLLTELVWHSFNPIDFGLFLFFLLGYYEFYFNIMIYGLRRIKILDWRPFKWLPYFSILSYMFTYVLKTKFDALSGLIRTSPKLLVCSPWGGLWWLKKNFCSWGGKRKSAKVSIWGDEIEIPCSISSSDIKRMQQRGDGRFPKLVAAAYGTGINNFAKITGGWTWVTEYYYQPGICSKKVKVLWWWVTVYFPCIKRYSRRVKKYVEGNPSVVRKVLKEAIQIWNKNAFVKFDDKCKYLKNKPKSYANDPNSMKRLIRDGKL